MARIAWTISLAVVLALASRSFGQPGVPRSPPPHAARAIVQGGQLFLVHTVSVPMMETRQREVTVNGKVELEIYAVCLYACEFRTSQHGADDYRVMTVGGEQLTPEQAAEKLKAETEVLVSTGGKRLDPAYQPLYLPETLIVYLRHRPPPHAVAPAPPDSPPTAGGEALPAEGATPRVPLFANVPPPKGPPPVVGFATKSVNEGPSTADDTVRLGASDWRPIHEKKTVEQQIKDAKGTLHKVVKEVLITHWLAESRWLDVPLAELKLLGRDGQPLAANKRPRLTGGTYPVLLLPSDAEFDAAHLKHFRPEVPIAVADLPPPEGQVFPNVLPPHETLAKVNGERLIIYTPIFETQVEKVPVTAVQDGKEVTKLNDKVTVAMKVIGQDYPLADVKATDAAGKVVEVATLAERLGKPGLVLAFENGWPVGDIYLQPVKPQTLVFVLPPWSPPAAGAERPPDLAKGEWPVSGSPPRFGLAQVSAADNLLVLREPQQTTIRVPKQVPKTVDGETVFETMMEDRIATHWDEHAIGAGNYRLAGMDGKLLHGEQAIKRLSKETMVLVSDQGQRVDPAWLTIFKPEAVIVYLRPTIYGGDEPAPAPPAVPKPE